MPFQRSVNREMAPAVEGDFASSNPYRSMIAGPGELTAGAAGVTIGRFAFARNDNGVVANAHPGVACRVGFVQRSQPVLITAFLGAASMLIPAGLEITLHDAGDFWARFAAGADIGQRVYADYASGLGSAGSALPAGAAFTGVIAAGVLTASAVTGTIVPGQPITGTGVDTPTFVGPQLSGTPGGAGTYSVVGDQTAASTAMTTTGGYDTGFVIQSKALAGELAKIAKPITL